VVLHLWPAAIFAGFVAARAPEELMQRRRAEAPARAE
jgi:hypothetical protein